MLRGGRGEEQGRIDGAWVRAKSLAEARGLARWPLNISHGGGMAIAFVMAMC
jgi:hypothetical protein